MKKLVVSILAVFLISLSVGTFAAAEGEPQTPKVNLTEEQKLEQIKAGYEPPHEWTEEELAKREKGYIPDPTSHIEEGLKKEEQKKKDDTKYRRAA